MGRKKSWRGRPTDEDLFEDDEVDDGAGGGGCGAEKPLQRNAANARERARMRVLSKAFCRLKTTLPWVPADTKLSKLDTLRLATSYIAHLRSVLCLPQDAPSPPDKPAQSVHPLNLTWPYSFQLHLNNGSNSSSPCADDWKRKEWKASREKMPARHPHYPERQPSPPAPVPANTPAMTDPYKFRPLTPPADSYFSDVASPAIKFKSEDLSAARQRLFCSGYSVLEPSKRLYALGEEKS